jgi:hypothetical protein
MPPGGQAASNRSNCKAIDSMPAVSIGRRARALGSDKDYWFH